MKTIQQVLGYVQGWQQAICTDDEEYNKDNLVYQALITIENYIKKD